MGVQAISNQISSGNTSNTGAVSSQKGNNSAPSQTKSIGSSVGTESTDEVSYDLK